MRKRITALAVVGLALLAFAVGCSDKQLDSAYQASLTQVAAQADSIRTLQSQIATEDR